MRKVSLREANQRFSKIIADVERGEEIVITRRGEPIARLTPQRKAGFQSTERQTAHAGLMKHLRRGAHLKKVHVNRDDIYGRGL